MKKGKAPIRDVKEFEEEVIQIDRVTRVVKGGRRLRFRATVAIGNKRGKVGIGIGKSTEVQGAISKAIAKAKKSLVTVPLAGQTIPHRVQVKHKSAKILLIPAIPGTGIKVGGSVRKVIELSGIKNIMGKCLGTTNRLSNSQATIEALRKLKTIPWLKVKGADTDAEQAVTRKDSENTQKRSNKKPFNKQGKKPFSKGKNNNNFKPETKSESKKTEGEK